MTGEDRQRLSRLKRKVDALASLHTPLSLLKHYVASLTIDDDTANVSTMIFKVAKHYANTDSLYLEVRHYNGVSNERFAPCLQLMQELGLDGRLYATALTNEAATLRQLHLDYSKHRQSIEFACCFVYATMVDPKVTLHTHLPAILPPPLPF